MAGALLQVTVPEPVIGSSTVPPDVAIPDGFPEDQNPIAFFDDYSWRAFIALVWPARKDQRGLPEPRATVGGPGPRVFETYKALWEVFHPDGSAPADWNAFEPSKFNPCKVDTAWGDLTLGSFTKFGDLGQAGVGSLIGPLVAQPKDHPTYVRFLTGFNKLSFDFLLNPDPNVTPPKPIYLRANLEALPRPVTFQNGAMTLKSSWMIMTHAAHPERYYTRRAWVLDPETGQSVQTAVGLVGLHIVQKTPSRPQWIWATFEHVDNVPPAEPGAPGTFAFNDGTGTAMPQDNPYTVSPLPIPTPAPYNVTRIMPVHPSTAATNAAYRKALQGTIWANYQLVMTQWPLKRNMPNVPGTPANTFPGTGASTAFANTTMETFDQGAVKTGCMNCHNFTRTDTDFVWSLEDHAFPPTLPAFLLQKESFRELRNLMLERRKK
jgi:hypothetical protein